MNVELLAEIIRNTAHDARRAYFRDERDDARYEVGNILEELAAVILRHKDELEGNA